jgi:diguanylate cyclase (GGDEF)-like protein
VRLAARGGQSFALILLDLDNFKAVNDSLGHHVGDQLLIGVAGRLMGAVRQSDLVARLGGDEFVILLPDIDAPADAAHVADKILAALAAPCRIEGHELRTSPSIGICLYPSDATDSLDLLQKADAAMYHAKSNGRNQYQFFKEEYQQAAVRRLALEADLRKAIERKEFQLHYQPQFDLRRGRVIGVEALIRWRHPERGLVSPLDFIPIAEETGLILPIGDWVLEEACRQLADWRSRDIDGLSVSVNLTASQFLDPALPERIRELLDRHALRPDMLALEVTESMSMASPEQTIASMRELVARGLSLSIDDFGTGYSSLAYLKLFPVRTLKIDRSFVKDIETDQSDADICDVTVLLAHKLGLDVVAEGVETEAQLKYLLSIGCEKLQGYLISKPLPADALERFIGNTPPVTWLGTVELWEGAGRAL